MKEATDPMTRDAEFSKRYATFRYLGKCRGCHRPPMECWEDPCSKLEDAIDQGTPAVNRWAVASHAPFRVTARRSS